MIAELELVRAAGRGINLVSLLQALRTSYDAVSECHGEGWVVCQEFSVAWDCIEHKYDAVRWTMGGFPVKARHYSMYE